MAQQSAISEERADAVRPSSQQSVEVLTTSQAVWTHLYNTARTLTPFPSSCGDLLIHQTPSIPSLPSVVENEEHGYLYIEGGSEWAVETQLSCELEQAEISLQDHRMVIGSTSYSHCTFTEAFIQEWPGIDSDENTTRRQPNLLGVLVLGWSYVLSALTVELRSRTCNDQVVYTNETAMSFVDNDTTFIDDSTFVLHVGDIEDAEERWWSAILANGIGWKAIIERSGQLYYPPWSIHQNGHWHFKICRSAIKQGRALTTEQQHPSTSKQAFRYLWNLCCRHQIQDQFRISLAAALTIPRHNRFGAAVELPPPTASPLHDWKNLEYVEPPVQFNLLPNYAALSSMPRALLSALCGSFWEPGIDCNMVSEWLHAPLEEIIPSIEPSHCWGIVTKMMAMRRPTLGSFWLGSLITGLVPSILRAAKSCPPTSLEAVVWTKSRQSFMDPPNEYVPKLESASRHTNDRILMRRQDELRLLFLTKSGPEGYQRPPLSPWPPFGSIELNDAAFEAQIHVSCRHSLRYKHWVWKLEHGELFNDAGASVSGNGKSVSSTFTPIPEVQAVQGWKISEVASRLATQQVFSWSIFEGRRAGEIDLWAHDWLRDLQDDEDDESEVGSVG